MSTGTKVHRDADQMTLFSFDATRPAVAATWVTRNRGQSVLITHDGAVVVAGVLEDGDERAVVVRDGAATVLVMLTGGHVLRTLPPVAAD